MNKRLKITLSTALFGIVFICCENNDDKNIKENIPCAINSDSYGFIELKITSNQNPKTISRNIILNGVQTVKGKWDYYFDGLNKIVKIEYSYLDTIRSKKIFFYFNDSIVVDVYTNLIYDSSKDKIETYFKNIEGSYFLKKTRQVSNGLISDSTLIGWSDGNIVAMNEYSCYDMDKHPTSLYVKTFTYNAISYAFKFFPEKTDIFGEYYFKPKNNVSQLHIERYRLDSSGNKTLTSESEWNYDYIYSEDEKLLSYNVSNGSRTYYNEVIYKCNK